MTDQIYSDVRDELARQSYIYGEMKHPGFKWVTILTKQVGELSAAVINQQMDRCRHEAVQVAAVALQIIKAIDDERTIS